MCWLNQLGGMARVGKRLATTLWPGPLGSGREKPMSGLECANAQKDWSVSRLGKIGKRRLNRANGKARAESTG